MYFNSYLSLSFSQLRNLLSTTAITSIATPLSLSQPKYLPLYKPHSFVHLATCTHLSLSLSQPRHAYLHMYMYNLHVHVSTVCNRHSTPHTCRPPLRDQISAALWSNQGHGTRQKQLCAITIYIYMKDHIKQEKRQNEADGKCYLGDTILRRRPRRCISIPKTKLLSLQSKRSLLSFK